MRKLMFGFCVAVAIIILSGCTNRISMKNVHNEPHFAGVVVEVFDGSILVRVNEVEAVRDSGDLVFVSLDVYLGDSMTDFMSGDEVLVFFDGMIMETYPAQINTVYAIILTSPSKMSVWHSTIGVEIYHTKDGHTTGYSFTERSSIDELFNWFTRLTLTRTSPQDSVNLSIEALEEVYEFALSTSEHFSWDEENEFTAHDTVGTFLFHYGRIGSTWYLLFGEILYEVNNPSDIIFPAKHGSIVFEPAKTPELFSGSIDPASHALSFTIQEWCGEADNAIEPIYTDFYYIFELSQVRSHLIMLTFDDGRQMSLRDALFQMAVTIDELISAGLRVSKREFTPDDIPTRNPNLYLSLITVDTPPQYFRAAQGDNPFGQTFYTFRINSAR